MTDYKSLNKLSVYTASYVLPLFIHYYYYYILWCSSAAFAAFATLFQYLNADLIFQWPLSETSQTSRLFNRLSCRLLKYHMYQQAYHFYLSTAKVKHVLSNDFFF